MSEKEEILTEIHGLIEEQMEALKGPLNQDAASEYGRRSSRIQELLERIGAPSE